MMWWKKVKALFLGEPNWEALAKLNPQCFTDRDIANILYVSEKTARRIAKVAVRREEFKELGVCQNGYIYKLNGE